MNSHCIFCDLEGHTLSNCPIKNPQLTRNQLSVRGKYFKEWRKTKKKWIQLNPPKHEGYYICYICQKWISANEVELDHIESRSRHPELRYELDNLKPCCRNCNYEKGSLSLEQFLDKKSL